MDPLDIAGLGVDAFKLGYNIYTNKRDFDYQKALQQQIFNREDTAVQRRMADLKAAGLNPNLAAGQGAAAGTVVSRSNTNDLGSALDTTMAINSMKQQRYQTAISKNQKTISDYETETAKYENIYQQHKLLADMGLVTMPYFEDGHIKLLTPDNLYASTTVPIENSEASIIKSRDVLQSIIRESAYLQNTLNKTTTDMILGNAQLSQWKFNNTLDIFNALSGRNLTEQQIEQASERIGIDIKKMNFQQTMQSLPMILMLLSFL